MTTSPSDDVKNIQGLVALFKHVGLSTDMPLVAPMIVEPPAGQVAVDATNLSMNVNPQAVQGFVKQLAMHQPQGSVHTRWGKGFYSCDENELAFLVEQIKDRPGERLEFSIGPLSLITSEDDDENEAFRTTCNALGVSPSHLIDDSFAVSFTYFKGTDMQIGQMAKMTPNGTYQGLGVYGIYLKTPTLRAMADAVGDDEELHRIASVFEQGKQRELLNDGTAKSYPPHLLDKIQTETAFFHVRPFNPGGYVEPVSPTVKSLIRGAAKLVPNLMTTVPPAPFARL